MEQVVDEAKFGLTPTVVALEVEIIPELSVLEAELKTIRRQQEYGVPNPFKAWKHISLN